MSVLPQPGQIREEVPAGDDARGGVASDVSMKGAYAPAIGLVEHAGTTMYPCINVHALPATCSACKKLPMSWYGREGVNDKRRSIRRSLCV
jgi:hypothetical protein